MRECKLNKKVKVEWLQNKMNRNFYNQLINKDNHFNGKIQLKWL